MKSSLRLASVLALLIPACTSSPPAGDGGTDGGGADAPVIDCTGRPSDGPGARGEVAGALDEERGLIVVYGGNTSAPEMCMPRTTITDETWLFHLDCNNWERVTGASPGLRARVATTVDTTRDRMLAFGGRNQTGFGVYENYGDVWAFDFATRAWSAVATTGTGPSPRSSSSIAYDAARDRLIVFGGNSSTSGLTLTGVGDTFALDLTTGVWSEISGAGPSGRLYHGGTVVNGRFYVYGGTPDFDGPFFGDLWALDLTTDTWSEVSATNAPDTRFGGELFGDAAGGRLLMAFGHDITDLGNRNDVEAFDIAGGAWSTLRAGDTLNGVPSGPCMFPSDFTLPEEGTPERRYGFVRAEGATRGYVLFGKTDCGNVNDVVSLDYATGAFEILRPATVGEACNRTGRLGCSTLCF
jgi:hypothetical protein